MNLLGNETWIFVLFLAVNFNFISTQEPKEELCDDAQNCVKKAMSTVSLRCDVYQNWFKSPDTQLGTSTDLLIGIDSEKYEIIDINMRSPVPTLKIKKLDYTDSGHGSYFAKTRFNPKRPNCTYNIFVYDGISKKIINNFY